MRLRKLAVIAAALAAGFAGSALAQQKLKFAHVYDGTLKMNPAIASFSFPNTAARQITLRDVDIAQAWIKQGTGGIYRYDVLARGQKHDWNGDGIADLPKLTIERMRSYHTFSEASGVTVKRGMYPGRFAISSQKKRKSSPRMSGQRSITPNSVKSAP